MGSVIIQIGTGIEGDEKNLYWRRIAKPEIGEKERISGRKMWNNSIASYLKSPNMLNPDLKKKKDTDGKWFPSTKIFHVNEVIFNGETCYTF